MEKPQQDPQLDAVYTVVSRESFSYDGTDIGLFRKACQQVGITPSATQHGLCGEEYDPNRSDELVSLLFTVMRANGMNPNPSELADKAEAWCQYYNLRWLQFDEQFRKADEGSEAELDAQKECSVIGLVQASWADTRDCLRALANPQLESAIHEYLWTGRIGE